MKLNLIDAPGDWNPQLLRELKSKVTRSNVFIAGAISILGQTLLYMMLQFQLPIPSNKAVVFHRNCTGDRVYEGLRVCIVSNFGDLLISWQFWWLNLFISLTLVGTFALLVGGTYLLIHDLYTEQHRGTINFLLLSPQSPKTILIGKLLGVPSLLYFIAILAIPLHLKAGLAAQIPLHLILIFYAILIAGCGFFYSAALLFSLINSSFAMSAWLAIGGVLFFLWMTYFSSPTGTLIDWLFLFSPNQIIPYLSVATRLSFYPGLSMPALNAWRWFSLPIGANVLSLAGAIILNYSLWTYWVWQALQRRFPNPRQTLLSKRQSYFLIFCFQITILGFATFSTKGIPTHEGSWYDFQFLLDFNLIMFLALIASITPSRQAVQDWARYRQLFPSKQLWQFSLIKDLMWKEKSPAVLAILLNLAIASIFLINWLFLNLAMSDRVIGLLSLLVYCNFMLFCTIITQIIVLRITQKTVLWIAGLFIAIFMWPVIFNLVSRYFAGENLLWLFTPYAWEAIKSAQGSILLAIFVQWLILGLCTLSMLNDIKKAGESASKALFTPRNLSVKEKELVIDTKN